MSDFCFQKAERQSAPVTVALIGKSGSGKTLSALKLARGLVGEEGKIAVIDTEGKRACMYADNPEVGGFDHSDFRLPYSSERFYQAVKSAAEAGYGAIVIDSASHEHEGEGGMLSYADAMREKMIDDAEQKAKRFNKQFNRDWYDPGFAVWNKPKGDHNKFVRYAVGCPAHIIFCIRMKTVNEMRTTENGKKEMVEVDKPVCEGQLLYEMTLAVELGSEPHNKHKARYIKVPEPFKPHIRDGEIITVNHGKLLMQEASEGVKQQPQQDISVLRQTCEHVATLGMQRLEQHWRSLDKDQKQALQAQLPAFKEIAAQADADNTQQEGAA